MTLSIFKALHLIFMVSWFAGLFYMVRLFIYFAEANLKEGLERDVLLKQFKIMQWRLWYIISWPSMILTLVFGIGMLCINPVFLEIPYMQLKLGFVFLLILYHLQSHFIFLQQKNNIVKYSSNTLRIWNEVATLFLVSIVFIIVLKNELTWIYGTVGFVLFGIILMLGIRLYKKVRSKG
jgi:putative membrane protein